MGIPGASGIHRIAILFAKYLKPPIRSLHVAWPWFLGSKGSGDKGWRLVAGLQSASSEPGAAQDPVTSVISLYFIIKKTLQIIGQNHVF